MPRLTPRSSPPPRTGAALGARHPLPSGGKRPLRNSLPTTAHAERRTVGAVVAILVTVWLVAVFGRALADANALEQRHAREEATNATLRAEVAAGRAEIAFIQTDDFLTYEARSYGMGAPGEHAFALEPGAPDPRPITPLGSADEAPASTSPLDDWLKLLLGG